VRISSEANFIFGETEHTIESSIAQISKFHIVR
jgi:hypothetical protein